MCLALAVDIFVLLDFQYRHYASLTIREHR
jgi:hypothetical protein